MEAQVSIKISQLDLFKANQGNLTTAIPGELKNETFGDKNKIMMKDNDREAI
jgi:hypothetical protein